MPLINPEQYTVIRKSKTQWVNGKPVVEDEGKIEIWANYQPKDGYMLQRVPEGLRQRNWIVIYSDTLLRTVKTDGPNADVFIDENGVKYQVHHGKPWRSAALIPHHEVYAVAAQTNEEAP